MSVSSNLLWAPAKCVRVSAALFASSPRYTAEAIAAGVEVGMSASGVKKNLPKLIHQKYIFKKAHGLYEKVPSCSLQTLSTLGTFSLSEAHVDTESSQSTPNSIVPKCNDNNQPNQTPIV